MYAKSAKKSSRKAVEVTFGYEPCKQKEGNDIRT